MTIEDQIKDGKLQYDINREAAKISALLSGKIDNYDYLTGEEILLSNQQQIIEQAKFTYSALGKAFQRQTKTIEDQGKKQVDALADLKPKEIKPKEIKPRETKPNEYGNYFLNGLAKILESYEPIDFNNLVCHFKKPNIYSISFIDFKAPLHIFKDIYDGDKTLEDIEKEQIDQENKKRQKVTLKIFMIQEKKLFNFLMIMLRTCLEIFMIQNNKEQDLKY